MSALDTNAQLDNIKNVINTMVKTNGYTFDVKTVSRRNLDPNSQVSPNETPAIIIQPGKDVISERGIREDHRLWTVLIGAYIAQQNIAPTEDNPTPAENAEIEKLVEELKKDTVNVLKANYASPTYWVDPILWAEVGDVDPSMVDGDNTDAAFLVALNVHYLM